MLSSHIGCRGLPMWTLELQVHRLPRPRSKCSDQVRAVCVAWGGGPIEDIFAASDGSVCPGVSLDAGDGNVTLAQRRHGINSGAWVAQHRPDIQGPVAGRSATWLSWDTDLRDVVPGSALVNVERFGWPVLSGMRDILTRQRPHAVGASESLVLRELCATRGGEKSEECRRPKRCVSKGTVQELGNLQVASRRAPVS